MDKIEMSQVSDKHSISVARKVQAGCLNHRWAEFFGLIFIRRVRGQSFGTQGPQDKRDGDTGVA